MRNQLICVLFVSAALVGGCTKTTETVGAAPATPAQLESLREMYAAKRPGTIVGSVTAVRPEDSLVAVGDVKADSFLLNDLVSIVDSAENTIAFGHVVRRLEGDGVHVKYESRDNARAPQQGDMVVRFPR